MSIVRFTWTAITTIDLWLNDGLSHETITIRMMISATSSIASRGEPKVELLISMLFRGLK